MATGKEAEKMLKSFLELSFDPWLPNLTGLDLVRRVYKVREGDVWENARRENCPPRQLGGYPLPWILDKLYHCDGTAMIQDRVVGIDVTVNPGAVEDKVFEIRKHKALLQSIGLEHMLVILWPFESETFDPFDLDLFEKVNSLIAEIKRKDQWVRSLTF